ncbi:MAG: GAF domain-containing protein [Sphingomicrobium sp.]
MTINDDLNAPRRLAALRRTGLMDSGREKAFDQICRLASELLHAPSAFVSLIGGDRHYIKSNCATDDSEVDTFDADVGLDISFCKHVVASGKPFVVEDARDNPLVSNYDSVGRGVIAYAGVPFHAEGETVGAICVVDSEPRKWTDEDLGKLHALAQSVETLMDPGHSNSSPDEPQFNAPYLRSLRDFLRASAAYRAILSQSAIDLAGEESARERLSAASKALHRDFSECSAEQADSIDDLIVLQRRYFGAEERRRKQAEQFASGHGQLADLQSAIVEVSEAEDALRLAALDAGISL